MLLSINQTDTFLKKIRGTKGTKFIKNRLVWAAIMDKDLLTHAAMHQIILA